MIAREYFQQMETERTKIHYPLRALLKGFYTFEHSAHSPLFEEPEKTLRILLEDVLNRTNTRADR